MPRTGAQTARFRIPAPGGRILGERFEIAVSTTLLLETFRDGQHSVVVCGIECGDRLAALQRLFEHEMVHLIELLVWHKSRCGAPRFGSIASRSFAHTDYRHQILTRAEQVLEKRGIRQGDGLAFCRGGREYVGRVNRVTRRATVLADDDAGTRYSDGRRYAKFYVPVEMLKPLQQPERG